MKVARETREARLALQKAKAAGDEHTHRAHQLYRAKGKKGYLRQKSLVLPTLKALMHEKEMTAYSGHMLQHHGELAVGAIELLTISKAATHFEKVKPNALVALRHNELCATAFARRLAKKPVLRGRVDARELLQQAAEAIQVIRFVKPKVEVDESARFIKTDAALFYQMVFDGLENARKAVEAKFGIGETGLEKKNIKIKMSLTNEGKPLIQIEDNGIGVTEQQATKGESNWPAGMFFEDTGFGAKTIRENAELLGGECVLKGKRNWAVLEITLPPKPRTRRRAA
ncbi:MAG: ATP-binding protein [Candidatus Norongarragalinales archaeon]